MADILVVKAILPTELATSVASGSACNGDGCNSDQGGCSSDASCGQDC